MPKNKKFQTDWVWKKHRSGRTDWNTQIPLSEEIQCELTSIYDTLCELARKTTADQVLRHFAPVQAPAIHAQLVGDMPCHKTLLHPIGRFIRWLFFGADGVHIMPGVEQVEWVDDPDCDTSPASKFVQRYPRHLIGYHFRMTIYRQDREKVGSMTAVILFSKKKNPLTCWIFNETNLSPSLPPPGRCRQLWLELRQHFGFGNTFTCDDVLRIEQLFQNAPATDPKSFQKSMPPLGFSTGATECAEFVKFIVNRLVRTLAWDTMLQEAEYDELIITGSGDGIEGGDGVYVRMQFSQQDKNGKILARATLRPSFLVDSVPTSFFQLSFMQVVPWDVD